MGAKLVVPSSLEAEIAPILRVAGEVESSNPRVAYLCRFYAFEKSHALDSTGAGQGVRKFRTELLQILEKEQDRTLRLRKDKSDAREMQAFCQHYYKKYIEAMQNAVDKPDCCPLTKEYQTAAVLSEVLKALNPGESGEVVDEGWDFLFPSTLCPWWNVPLQPLHAHMLEKVYIHHPETFAKMKVFESEMMNVTAFATLAKVVKDLGAKQIIDLNVGDAEKMLKTILDLQVFGFDVEWMLKVIRTANRVLELEFDSTMKEFDDAHREIYKKEEALEKEIKLAEDMLEQLKGRRVVIAEEAKEIANSRANLRWKLVVELGGEASCLVSGQFEKTMFPTPSSPVVDS